MSSPVPSQAALYSTSYSYDVPNGRVTRTDPDGQRIRYQYDAANRLNEVRLLDASGQPTFAYEYDLTDQLTRQTYPGGQQTYTYDDFDRLETVTDFGQSTPLLVFSYDHQDRVTWIAYLNNGEVCYEYDPDGRITRVGRVLPGHSASVCGSADEKTDYVYDNRGRLKTIRYPNGIQGFTEYDGATGQVKVTGYRGANGALIYSDTFTYVPGSRLYQSITRKTATESKQTAYTYDAWERLLTVTEADGRKTDYEYDAFGNRTKETITNINNPGATGGSPKPYGTYVYEYGGSSNRLNRILYNGQPLETYTYNNSGRITQRVHTTVGTTTYTYDDRGLLTQVTKSGLTVSYTYDALGTRKTKTINGTTTRYLTAPLFGMSRVLAELTPTMGIKATYVYSGQQLLKEEPVAGNHNQDLYLLSDGIVGSLTHATDVNGQVKDEYRYDAFGIRSTLTDTSNSQGHYGYTGQEYDEETGLLYLRARYYDPALGRFISADPFWGRLGEPSSQNRYVYVRNNPLLYSDPSGLDTKGYSANLTVAAFGWGFSIGYYVGSDDMGNSAVYISGAAGKAAGWGISLIDSRETTNANTILDLEGVGHRTDLSGGLGAGGEAAFLAGSNYTGKAIGLGLTLGSPVMAQSESTYSSLIWDNYRSPIISLGNIRDQLVPEPVGVCPAQ